MIAVQQTMAAEVATLAGPRYARQTGNDLQRWGNQQGLVYVNGQKVNLSNREWCVNLPTSTRRSNLRRTRLSLSLLR